MKRDDAPLSTIEARAVAPKPRFSYLPFAPAGGPVAKLVDLMNSRNSGTEAEASKSYEEFCTTMQRLHNEKTFVPPVCLT